MSLRSYLPILSWLPGYSTRAFGNDLSAGLTVGVMLIPQGMAYAMLAGLPPIYGLYASTVPLILYAIFGTSRQLSVGPVAMDSLLLAIGVGKLAEFGSDKFISLAILLAFMVGAVQLLLGIFRLGFMVNFLSHPVISGFTTAAALIIGLNQIPHLFGIQSTPGNQIQFLVPDILVHIQDLQPAAFLLGLGGMAVILISKRLHRAIPGALVALVLGISVVYFLGLSDQGVHVVRDVPAGLPSLQLPLFSWMYIKALLPTALTIALVGFMESYAVARAAQAKHKNYKLHANQELVALGMANLGGSFFQGFPIAGGFSRTAVNDQAGAVSGMASIFSALLIVLTLLFLTPLFYYLPHAILAAVILIAVVGLIDVKEIVHLWKTDRRDLVLLLVTLLATLVAGIQEGIAIGVGLSLALVLYKSSHPHVAILGRLPGTTIYRNVNRFKDAQEIKGVLIMRFDAQLFFANAHIFYKLIDDALVDRDGLKLVVVNAEAINTLDSTAAHMLTDLADDLRRADVDLVFTGVKGPVRDIMMKNRIVDKLGKGHFFNTIQEAIDHFDGEHLDEKEESTFQTNLI